MIKITNKYKTLNVVGKFRITLMNIFTNLAQIEEESSILVKQKLLTDVLLKSTDKEIKQILNFCLCEPDLIQKSDQADVVVSENIIQSALSKYLQIPIAQIKADEKQFEDLSDYAYNRFVQNEINEGLTLSQFFETIHQVSQILGFGSDSFKEIKIYRLFLLCQSALEVKFIVRFLRKKMRIGFNKRNIEKVLNQLALGDQKYNQIQTQVLAYSNSDIQVGIPILSTLAQSFDTCEEIENNFINQDCYCEEKYDGERIQVHFDGQKVEIFSRNMEKRAWKYPLLIEKLAKYFKERQIENGIFDCEMVCFDLNQRVIAFQEMQSQKKITSEIGLICFDVLYFNSQSLIKNVLTERQKISQSVFAQVDEQYQPIHSVESKLIKQGQKGLLQQIYCQALEKGLEGIMVKRNVPYKPGSRTDWAKLKMQRDLDLALIGAYWGRGKRCKFFGAFLLGALDIEHGQYNPISKHRIFRKNNDRNN